MGRIKLSDGSVHKIREEIKTFKGFFSFRPLKRHKRTVEELVKITGLSERTVRRHLKWLEENGYVVKKRLWKGKTGKGRPKYVYFATKPWPVINYCQIIEVKPRPGKPVEVYRIHSDGTIQVGQLYIRQGKIVKRFRKNHERI